MALWWNSQWASDTYQLGPVGGFLVAITIAASVLLLSFVRDVVNAKCHERFDKRFSGAVEDKCENLAMGYFWEKHGKCDNQPFSLSELAPR